MFAIKGESKIFHLLNTKTGLTVCGKRVSRLRYANAVRKDRFSFPICQTANLRKATYTVDCRECGHKDSYDSDHIERSQLVAEARAAAA